MDFSQSLQRVVRLGSAESSQSLRRVLCAWVLPSLRLGLCAWVSPSLRRDFGLCCALGFRRFLAIGFRTNMELSNTNKSRHPTATSYQFEFELPHPPRMRYTFVEEFEDTP